MSIIYVSHDIYTQELLELFNPWIIFYKKYSLDSDDFDERHKLMQRIIKCNIATERVMFTKLGTLV